MVSITCNCGFKVEDEDPYKTEAMAWHHAIRDHLDMLKEMTIEQLEEVVRSNDEQMKLN